MKVSNVHSAKATFNAHRRMSQARVLAFWSISVAASMLAALASSVNVPMHAGEPDNRTASSVTFAREDRTTTSAPLCTFEAEIPSQCECVAALRLSDAVGSVGAGAMIGAVVFVARSGLNAFFCDEQINFNDEEKESAAAVPLERLSLCLECPPAPTCTPTPGCIHLIDAAEKIREIRAEDDENARPAIDLGRLTVKTPEPFNFVRGAVNNAVKAAASVACILAYAKLQRTRPYR